MNPAEKKALIAAIKEIIPDHEHDASIEAYVNHYFWNWYTEQLFQKKTIDLENFYKTIPESCRVTAEERKKEFLLKHAELMALLADQVQELTTKKKST